MNTTTTDYIKEIAEQLDCSLRTFIHKTTGELLFVPDENDLIDIDPWDQEFEQLENNFSDYYEIDKWRSNDVFEIMTEFAEQVTDYTLKNRLFAALSKNKPFIEFKFVIDNSGDVRQQWFDFKNHWQQDFVSKQLIRHKQRANEMNERT